MGRGGGGEHESVTGWETSRWEGKIREQREGNKEKLREKKRRCLEREGEVAALPIGSAGGGRPTPRGKHMYSVYPRRARLRMQVAL